MEDPMWAADGNTYERSALVARLQQMEASGREICSPLTGSPLAHLRLVPDLEIRQLIEGRIASRAHLDDDAVAMTDHVLGRGAWGVVRKAKLRRPIGEEWVAVKMLPESEEAAPVRAGGPLRAPHPRAPCGEGGRSHARSRASQWGGRVTRPPPPSQ
eukprot:5624535-Prymnesium_polylepis.2